MVIYPAAALDSKAERAAALADYVELEIPNGPGPHPLAILLPGCLGWHAHHTKWRDELHALGYATLTIDSFAANGIEDRKSLEREVCSGQRVPGGERARDLLSVLDDIWDRPDILAPQTVLFGWSHGGWSVLEFLSIVAGDDPEPNVAPPNIDISNLRAAFLYYPYCGISSLPDSANFPMHTKTVIFHGKKDVITDPRQCQALADTLRAGGGDVEFISLQKSGHWFDNHAVRSVYDADATQRTRKLVNQTLQSIRTN